MYHGKPDTSSNIVWHRLQSTATRVDEELMQKSVLALSTTTDPLERLRLLCLSRGAAGIMNLGRIFRRMHNDGRKYLDKREFLDCVKQTGVELNKEDAEGLFKKFDTEHRGCINLGEFLRQLRPPMSERRLSLVEQVFKKLDKSGEGIVSVEDIRRTYAVTSHPLYMSGEETKELILTRFLANFETEGIVNGKVTLEEFMNYYSGISVSIEDDSFFDLMMRQAYKL